MIKNLKKIIIKYRLIIILMIIVIPLISYYFLNKTKTKENEELLAVLDLFSSQEEVEVVFDKEVPGLIQPFRIPQIVEIPAGEYTLQAFKEGFETELINFDLQPGDRKSFNFDLQKTINLQFFKLITEKDIKAIGWKGNKIFYHLRNEIKEAEKNMTLVNLPENSSLQFIQDGFALIKEGEKIWFYNSLFKIEPFKISSSLSAASFVGNFIAFLENQTINIYDIKNSKILNQIIIPQNNEVIEIFWSPEEEMIGFISLENQKYNLFITNINNPNLKKITTNDKKIINAFFSENKSFLIYSLENKVFIINLEKMTTIEIENRENNIQSMALNFKKNEILMIEKVQKDRIVDYISLINIENGKKKFIGISAPITKRIDFNVKPVFSEDKKGLVLAEKGGPVWLLIFDGELNEFFPGSE